MTLVKKSEKHQLEERLLKEIPELESLGWKKFHIDLLKKHFTFYIGLVNSKLVPQNENHKQFINTVKEWKTAKPKNVHEEIYLNYMKFYMKKNLDNKDKETIEDPIWKNVPQNIAGAKQYSQEMIDKLNTEYIDENDWFDDWKYR
ncbi:hypothetical protein OAA44_02740 [Candidatus Pelagibacter sp.]|jgi:hypothetical protein|nr:hypothetical protein [Candidatus Pelagibacter sp.]|tara:strand:- start:123 stop:557 length:435 start_codon:yes stop_codon:yes gene_type:complete